MGKLWSEMDNDELIHHYNCCVWGLREEVHVLAREFDRVKYVVPVVTSTSVYHSAIKPGQEQAKVAIEQILAERGISPVPLIDLTMMAEHEADWRQLGWRGFRDARRMGLDFAETGRFTG